jgi:hypothetical protein
LTSAWTQGLRAKIYFLVHRKNSVLQLVHLWFLLKNMGRKKKPESEKSSKPGIALDLECRDILTKILAFEAESELNDLKYSQAVRKCIRIAWEAHYAAKHRHFYNESAVALVAEGNASPQDSATTAVHTPETSAGGHLTRPTTKYQKGGRRKSTT